MKKRLFYLFGILAIIIVTFALLAFSYFGNYYAYGSYARKALRDTDEVDVTKTDDYIFFDGPGSGKALIFYPGAKVATEAYAPLMQGLAKKGLDCYLMHMPLHFAIFDQAAAEKVISQKAYSEYMIGGHSMGGAIAANYAAEHPSEFSGLILLAAYPTEKIDDHIRMLSVLGSNDCVINTDRYEACKVNWPDGNSRDVLIFGGNHAYFGNYGKQDGDGDATIKQKTQWRQTIEAIEEYYGLTE